MADLPKLPKRPNYFQAQFLVVRDFDDEQAYHKEMLRRHNRTLHEWGVVRDGLQVTKTGDNQNLQISPGSAIDSLGREIVLETAQLLSLDKVRAASQAAGPAQDVAITIAFRETDSIAPEDKYPGTDSVTRQMQSPIIDATKTPATDGSVITLARISVTANDFGQPNNAVRKLASSFAPRGGDILLDGALSFTSKSNPNPAYSQVGLDYDSGSDALRIRARTKDAPALDATHLTIKRDTGNVGIGTTPTTAKLSVSGAPYEGTLMDFVVAQYKLSLGYKSFESDTVSYYLDLKNNTEEFKKFLAFHKGNVGIGMPTPNAKLQVDGGVNTVLAIGDRKSAGSIGLQFLGSGYKHAALRFDGDNVIVENASESYLPSTWYKPNAQMNFIVRSGNVGIGTTAPLGPLAIGDSSVDGSDGYIVIGKRKGSGTRHFRIGFDADFKFTIGDYGNVNVAGEWTSPFAMDWNAPSGSLYINSGGNVGIGSPKPTAKLEVQGGDKLVQVPGTFSTVSEADNAVYFAPGQADVSSVKVGDLVQMGDERKQVIEVIPSAAIRVKPPGFRTRSGSLYLVRSGNPIFRAEDYLGRAQVMISGEGDVEVFSDLTGAAKNIYPKSKFKGARIVVGQTEPGATNWVKYGDDGVYADVDTSAAGFTSLPLYFTSLVGESNHWNTQGATSIYSADSKGFRIYINRTGLGAQLETIKTKWNWYINWIGIGK